jgi:hypothetical protein
LDKAEYHRILEELTESVQKKDYRHALELVDQVDWRRVKSIRTLNMVADVFDRNQEYDRELDVLKIAYSRSSIGRNILYRLTEVSLKLNDLNGAERYFQEFSKVAQNDNSRCILQYKLYRAKNAPLDAQIAVLEEYREREYTERWAFELAKLYARAGETQKCVDACDDLILWFSEGTYVRKAMELKMEYEPLTTSQKAIYDRLRIQALHPETGEEDGGAGDEPEPEKVTYTQPEIYTVEKEASRDATKAIHVEQAQAEAEPSEEQASSGAAPAEEEPEESPESGTEVEPEDVGTEGSGPDSEYSGKTVYQEDDRERDGLTAGERFRTGAGDFKNRLVHGLRDVFGGFTEEPDDVTEPVKNTAPEAGEETAPLHVIKDLEPEHQTTDIDIDSYPSEMKTSYPGDTETDLEAAIERSTEAAMRMGQESPEQTPQTEESAAESSRKTEPQVKAESIPKAEAQEAAENSRQAEPQAAEEKTDEESNSDRFGSTGPVVMEKPKEKSAVSAAVSSVDKETAGQAAAAAPTGDKAEAGQTAAQAPSAEEEGTGRDSAPSGQKQQKEAPLTPEEQLTRAIQNTVFDRVPASETPKRTPHYIEGLEVPDPEPTPEERRSRTITLSEVGENTVPISLDQILSEETPEERRIRILNKAKPTRMSEEQRKVFTYFARLPGMDAQILEALNGVYTHAGERTSLHGNIAVMGAAGSGKSRLSRGLVLTMCQDMGLEAAKVARISGADMNHKDPVAVVSKMSGGFLIIEDVSLMTSDTLSKLNQAMEFRTDCMILIIEDEKTNMRAFLKKHPSFAAKFEKVINIPVFTNDELVTFARTYASENDCRMDDMGILALYTLIGNNQKENEPMTVAKVKEIMDDAIHHATRGKKRTKRSSGKDKILILHEKDFEQ